LSAIDPVILLLEKLHGSSATIASAYHGGSIQKTDENARDIAKLLQNRLLSPYIREEYQLRASFRQFLNAALNTERLFSIGANVGERFERFAKLVDGYFVAFNEGRDADCERYEVETREAISDIADAIDDELTILQSHVATKFATVSTIAEKKKQNIHYQRRTQQLVDLLESFHFSDIDSQLSCHEELSLSFKSLLLDRIPAFRESLWSILEILKQYLFEFRKIEERAKRVRAFALHLNRNLDWEPKDWDEVAVPQDWLSCATPLELRCHPDVDAPEGEELLAEIARTIPAYDASKTRTTRPAGRIEEDSGNEEIKPPESPIRKAVRIFFRKAMMSNEGISARKWWAANPSIMGNINEEIWLLRVLAEHDNKGKDSGWAIRLISRPDPVFDGNILINDVTVLKRAA